MSLALILLVFLLIFLYMVYGKKDTPKPKLPESLKITPETFWDDSGDIKNLHLIFMGKYLKTIKDEDMPEYIVDLLSNNKLAKYSDPSTEELEKRPLQKVISVPMKVGHKEWQLISDNESEFIMANRVPITIPKWLSNNQYLVADFKILYFSYEFGKEIIDFFISEEGKLGEPVILSKGVSLEIKPGALTISINKL